jgi:hypothetical protein
MVGNHRGSGWRGGVAAMEGEARLVEEEEGKDRVEPSPPTTYK